MFAEAASKLGVELLYATDRCDQLDDPWSDGAIPVRYHEEWRSVDSVLKAVDARPVNAVLAVGDRPTVMAAYLSRLLGLPGHPPEAAAAARDKRLRREKLKAAGLPTPSFITVPVAADAMALLDRITFPLVIKPTVLSASRGVIRADDAMSFATAFDRVRRLLESAEVRELRDPEADVVQIEEYIEGAEYALEGLLENGVLRTLALFDKPDPLEGPFFEETIYVTPSRVPPDVQRQIEDAVSAAAVALGLHHGPIHAEFRVNARGVFVLEVAARPIGGLCAKALRFEATEGTDAERRTSIGFEEFLLRHALGEAVDGWTRESRASAVMMIPIPRSGVYRRVDGLEAAGRVPHVEEIQITAKPDQQLLALPEGASYLGFIFARADDAGAGGARGARRACAAPIHDRSLLEIMKRNNKDEGLRIRYSLFLFRLLRDVVGRERGSFAEEEVLHLRADQLLAFFLPGHQPVLVEDHLLALFPELPGLRRDVLVDALADLAGPRRRVQARHLLLELDALHLAAALVGDRFVVRARRPSTHCHVLIVSRLESPRGCGRTTSPLLVCASHCRFARRPGLPHHHRRRAGLLRPPDVLAGRPLRIRPQELRRLRRLQAEAPHRGTDRPRANGARRNRPA